MHPAQRFSNRVSDYVRGRPGYPPEIAPFLIDQFGLAPAATVVDLGAGTGLSAIPFTSAGLTVIPVEPNEAMRHACPIPAHDGTAEATGLPDQAADLVIAAQSFHWFDIPLAAKEARRMLRPPRNAAVFWNDRDSGASALMSDYEELIKRHNTDHEKVRHTNITPESITAFFGAPEAWTLARFANTQESDEAGFVARVVSSSYMPAVGQPGFDEMAAATRELFRDHQRNGFVTLHYSVRLYFGRLV